jgi:hypothetical protein
MFQDLDSTIEKLLRDRQAPAEIQSADVIFETPIKNYGTQTIADINLFLYEVKENRALRDPVPFVTQGNNEYTQKMPPLRVDCSYLVTTWSEDKNQKQLVANEHMLLGKTLAWLSSFPTIPETYLTGGLIGQIYAPPTMVAQLDGGRNMGEFWSALGIPPRPYFNLVVTITMDLNSIIARSAAVTTLTTGYQQGSVIASAEERILVGGTVRDKYGNPVADVWVRIEPLNMTQVTDASGHFTFENVMRRGGLTLRARASGYPEALRPNIEIPSVTGEYDLQFA